ncbi:serine hydrolase domain-containing protein [Marinilabilia rubra]|uniref:Serine hydrolase n=1 Tax=Marinilabilia rubra TaxID=2162893 RepID=A0A2U2B610_9BACT|nr:serine hydrolase domain-containing protein [Marinilabilia rubra]PWD98474.1 serine hydrolase [Marinilabilia rubra]
MKSSVFRWTICLLVVLGTWLSSCQTSGDGKGNRVNYRSNLLDSLLHGAVINNEIPGAVACIVKEGQVVYHKAFGWKNMEKRLEMDTNDIFRMASMTKGMTAVAVLQLYERGLIQLDEPVKKYLPEFDDPKILLHVNEDSTFTAAPANKDITIRMLLTHTSGIGYGFQNEEYNALVLKNNVSEGFGNDDRTLAENVRRIAALPLLHEPGKKYTYGMSYDVLGHLIEVVSGIRYDKYIQHYILSPLQMTDSYFLIPEEEVGRLVKVYQPGANDVGIRKSNYELVNYPLIKERRAFSGGADLCSTASDYARFVEMVLNKGDYKGTRILGERYVEMMLSKQTSLKEGGYEQGFAAWVTNDKGAAEGPMDVGSFGFGGFFDTYSWADPQKDYVAVLLLQMYPENRHDIHSKFQRIVYGVIDEF